MKKETLLKLELSEIKGLIPNILFNKLERTKVKNIEDVINIEKEEFIKIRGVGSKALNQLNDFKVLIKDSPDQFIKKIEEKSELTLVINEDSILGQIEIKYLLNLIPKKLINRFNQNKINNVYELSLVSQKEFKSWNNVGKILVNLFNELIIKLKEEPEIFILEFKNQTIPKELPFEEFNAEASIDLLDNFRKIINDYLSLIFNTKKYKRDKDILIKRYGLFNEKEYNTVEIGLYYELSNERIRQLIIFHLKNIKVLFNSETLEKPFCRINSEIIKEINFLEVRIKQFSIISSYNLEELLKKEFKVISYEKNKKYLNILLDILSINKSAPSFIPYSEADYFFTDKKINSKQFYNVAKAVYDELRDKVVPIKEFDLVILIKKKFKTLNKSLISSVINQLHEVQKIENENTLFQIRFDHLSSVVDLAERVLYEKNETMELSEIVSEINHRYFNLGVNKIITRESLGAGIARNKNITPKGKTGYYSLAIWNENTETIYDVVYKAFLHYNKPISHREVIDYVTTLRPNLKGNSIRTVTNDRFIALKNGKYILSIWENDYKNLIQKKNYRRKQKETKKEQLRKFLISKKLFEHPRNEVVKLAVKELGFVKPTAESSLKDKELFEVKIKNKRYYISPILNPLKKSISQKKKDVVENIHNYIEIKGGKVPLTSLINYLVTNYDVKKPLIYKYIREDILLETEVNYKGRGKIVKMLKRTELKSSESEWRFLKKKITREVKEVFEDPRQPRYNISFSDALDMFYKIVTVETSEKGLNGLEERLLPTFKKYFSNNDRNDRLNFLTQITTSLDPFFKKILLYAQPIKYIQFKNLPTNKQGLGNVIKNLDRLDKRENRFQKKERSASLIPFGKQMFVAYNNRNIEAHEAKNWSEKEIVHIINSCLIIYIFSIFEYYSELKSHV